MSSPSGASTATSSRERRRYASESMSDIDRPRSASATARGRFRRVFVSLLTPSSPLRLLVLGVFCMVMLFIMMQGQQGWETITSPFMSDSEAVLLDRYKVVARRQIQWMEEERETLRGLGGGIGPERMGEWNATERCRNTVQGASRVVDDRGYVCPRETVDSSGCCADMKRVRFACEACGQALRSADATATPEQAAECCDEYEDCVSCCMRPDQKDTLLGVIDSTRGHRLRAILSARDQFELCTAVCRTSSVSVRHENKYRDEKRRFCIQG